MNDRFFLALLCIPLIAFLYCGIGVTELIRLFIPEEWRMSAWEKHERTVKWLEAGHEIDIVKGKIVN